MLYSILLVFEVLLSIGLIVLILLQHGKGADAGAAFGSGASGTVFGARGSGNFLSHSTAILAALFFVNSLLLAYIVSHQPKVGSVVDTLLKQDSAPVVGDLPVPAAGVTGSGAEDLPSAGEAAPQSGGDLPSSKGASPN
ncbi:MAG: preprotein translocase subunit SecG [Thiotrichales bacterium]